MNLIIILTCCGVLVSCLDSNSNDAKYAKFFADQDDGDDGQYRPDNSGQYVPDDSGRYYDDGTGRYAEDNSGRYSSGNYNQNSGRLNRAGFFQQISRRAQSSGAPNRPSGFRPVQVPQFEGGSANNNNYRPSISADGKWKIIRQYSDVNSDEGYNWEFETENRIVAEEKGKIFNKGASNEVTRSEGFFQYPGTDGRVYSVKYTADENGFNAFGDHLPTPPPIPEELIKAYELDRSQNRIQ